MPFTNGLAMYNALRFNNKKAVLLAYPGEGHGLRGMANRKDLTIRFFQFFDHYLKGGPSPKWLTDGVPFLDGDGVKDPKGRHQAGQDGMRRSCKGSPTARSVAIVVTALRSPDRRTGARSRTRRCATSPGAAAASTPATRPATNPRPRST